jgi:hypothetical protein
LISFTEVSPQDSCFNEEHRSAGSPGSGQVPGSPTELWDTSAVHCGTPMHLVTPAIGPAAAHYTFEPDAEGPVELPPVWRCPCGFQLDAWLPLAGTVHSTVDTSCRGTARVAPLHA